MFVEQFSGHNRGYSDSWSCNFERQIVHSLLAAMIAVDVFGS